MNRIILVILLASLALSACNTFHGMGEDISDAGHAISHAASK